MFDVLKAYKSMYLIRTVEETVLELVKKKLILGTTHACIGQEAVAVGAMLAKRPGDVVFSNHRGHGHMLACGVSAEGFLSELLGFDSGTCGGNGGSQHIMDKSVGFMGSNGITAGQVPIAVGYALGLKKLGKNNKSIVFLGDGAFNQGVVSESLNMASIYSTPVVFVCENNEYAMSSPIDRFIGGSILDRVSGFGINVLDVDGNDVNAVYNVMLNAILSPGPVFVCCNTYRFCGHSKSDMNLYRTREEIELKKTRDPLIICKDLLFKVGHSDEEILFIENEIKDRISFFVSLVGETND